MTFDLFYKLKKMILFLFFTLEINENDFFIF